MGTGTQPTKFASIPPPCACRSLPLGAPSRITGTTTPHSQLRHVNLGFPDPFSLTRRPLWSYVSSLNSKRLVLTAAFSDRTIGPRDAVTIPRHTTQAENHVHSALTMRSLKDWHSRHTRTRVSGTKPTSLTPARGAVVHRAPCCASACQDGCSGNLSSRLLETWSGSTSASGSKSFRHSIRSAPVIVRSHRRQMLG